MIPVLNTSQIREADAYTIEHEPVSSINLMERASLAFVKKFNQLSITNKEVFVFCGVGNNGGDGLAISRVFIQQSHIVQIFTIGNLEKASEDFKINLNRLKPLASTTHISRADDIPIVPNDAIVIDGLFGSGLSRPVEGLYADVIEQLNQSGAEVYSIDMPSGLFADKPVEKGAIVQADHTITFQMPKLAFFLPESSQYVGRWHVVDIELHPGFIENQDTSFYFTEAKDISLPARNQFDHKGSAGRTLLVSGSKGKMGAAILSAKAAMRSGCGLLFVHTPCCGLNVLQVSVPEAMVLEDEHTEVISEVLPEDNIDVIAMGPGIGTGALTHKAVKELILKAKCPLVLDADAINILAEDSSLVEALPPQSILTPHPGEFRRLVGGWSSDFEKLELLRSFCSRHQVNMVLKGAYSAVCNSEGKIFFNPTGNPGMATAGAGDVLTGIIGGLIAQKLSPFMALKTAVFLHGLAGDVAERYRGQHGLIASDLIEYLPEAMMGL